MGRPVFFCRAKVAIVNCNVKETILASNVFYDVKNDFLMFNILLVGPQFLMCKSILGCATSVFCIVCLILL